MFEQPMVGHKIAHLTFKPMVNWTEGVIKDNFLFHENYYSTRGEK